jgi:hypothetical protein
MGIMRSVAGIVTLGCILLSGSYAAFGANWTIYYEDGEAMHYYDKDSVQFPRKAIVHVSVKTLLLGAQEGQIKRLEMSCYYHTFRVLSDKVDPVTGQFMPEGAAGGYKWTWFPMNSRMTSLYENLCE